jgi:hypothetical protein
MKNDSLIWVLAVALGFAATACGSSTSGTAGSGGSAGTGGTAGAGGSAGTGGTGTAREAMGYVLGDFGFLHPEASATDFGDEGVRGFDLDSRDGGGTEPGTCPHDDFEAPDGTPGIDYGLWSFLSLYEPLQKSQLVDSVVSSAVKNGEMSIVMELGGVDDLVNDDEVTVQIFSTEDSPLVGTDGEVLPNGTLAVHPDTKFHSTIATGQIKDGVLEAGPFDVSIKFFIQIVDANMLLTDSRIRLTLGNGTASGILSAHWSVAQIDEIIGTPTTQNGNAAGFDYTEFLAAMVAADAGYDEESGECTSFTTIFRLEAVTAFLTD